MRNLTAPLALPWQHSNLLKIREAIPGEVVIWEGAASLAVAGGIVKEITADIRSYGKDNRVLHKKHN